MAPQVSDTRLPADLPDSAALTQVPDEYGPLLDDLFAAVERYNPDPDRELITRAFVAAAFAARPAEPQERRAVRQPPRRGRAHPAELHLDTATLAAALLHDVVEDTARRSPRSRSASATRSPTWSTASPSSARSSSTLPEEAAVQQPAQDAHRDGEGHPGHPHQARRPAAQHAHALRPERAEAARQGAETMEIYAPLAHRLGIRTSSGSSRTWPSTTWSRASSTRSQKWSPRAARRARTTSTRSSDELRAELDAGRHRGRDLRPPQAPLQHLPEDVPQKVRTSTRSTT